jgi:hypothetical protein
MGNRTPYEAWNGKKPHLGHLRIFGYKGHVRLGVPHVAKLDDRSVQMVYFGKEDGSKAHRMFNPQTNKIVVSRDVVFEEGEKWSWETAETEDFSVIVEEQIGEFIPHAMGPGNGSHGGQSDHLSSASGGAHSSEGHSFAGGYDADADS